ncbi:MAG: ABC transporter permease [Gemmatimonadota bacterium]
MSWPRRFWNLIHPGSLSRDLDRELQFHLDERTDALVEGGMSPPQAAQEARRQLGGVLRQKERTRDVDVVGWLDTVAGDIRYALRAIRGNSLAAAIAILSIALGIGANTAIFSLIDAVVLRPLAVERPGELVEISTGKGHDAFTNPIWEELRALPTLAGTFAFSEADLDLATGGPARRRPANFVSGGFFTVLGLRPLVGRLLQPADDVRGCPGIAVVSEGFWQRELGGSADVVGTTIHLHNQPFQVVGVLPRTFPGITIGRATDVYAPLCTNAIVEGSPAFFTNRSQWFLTVMGRLKPGQDAASASADLKRLAPAVFAATLPGNWGAKQQAAYLQRTLSVYPSPGGFSAVRVEYGTTLYLLMAVVAIVLVIACANVAQLLMARAAARQREIAVRLAVGASRGRLFRQLLTEGLVLSTLGAALGLLFAQWASRLLVRLLSESGDTVFLDTSIDWRLLGFVTLVALINGIAFGLAPAWRASTVSPQNALRAGGRTMARGEPGQRTGQVLVVGQIALALVLVTGGGLLLDTFRRLVAVDPGFRSDGLLLIRADLSKTGIADTLLLPLEQRLLERLRATPGVQGAAASRIAPLSHSGWNGFVLVDGYTPAKEDDALAWFNAVTPGFFATYGTSILAGRDFGPTDVKGGNRVSIVNEAAVKRFFGGRSPIGRTFRENNGDKPSAPSEIIGVVRDTKYGSIDESGSPMIYYPSSQVPLFGAQTQLAIHAADPASITPAVTAAIADVYPSISLDFATMSQQISASIARPRLLAVLSGFFGGLALLLALIGLYGSIAYGVSRRRSEIGIRLALGARPGAVLQMILREAGILAGAGLLIGTGLTLLGVHFLASMLYGTTPTNPATLAVSIGLVLMVALSAGAIPAWRAARTDPVAALRED